MRALLHASLASLAAVALALGAPRLLARVPPGARTPLGATALLVFLFVLASAAARRADPYALAIFAAMSWAALASLRASAGAPSFTPADLAVWLLLWIPFDLRWYESIFPGPREAAYAWWSLYLVIVAALGFGRLRAFPGFDYRLRPGGRDLALAGAALLVFGAIAIPVGLATGFLRFPPSRPPTLAEAAVLVPGIFLTVALPEEVYFRAILQAGLERALGRPAAALVLASAAFGLMHWNNRADPPMQVAYVGLATVAGLFYGTAYRCAGLVAAALCHAAVDVFWKLFLD